MQLWQSWARMEEKGGNERAALEVYQQATKLYPRVSLHVTFWGMTRDLLG